MKNTISMTVYLVNDSQNELLENVSSKVALDMLYPDSGAPISGIVFEAITDEGKVIKLVIGKDRITGNCFF